MSKIGRRPISFSTAKITVEKDNVLISGAKAKFEHKLPAELEAKVDKNTVTLVAKKSSRDTNMIWGLHRALLSNKIHGAEKTFDQVVKIVGLGYKAQLAGKKLTFSLGYSHKVEYTLPEGVSVVIDKTGQILTFSSSDKLLLGDACDTVKRFRLPEPYKGTGIMRENDVIIRKAGKTGTK